MSDAILTPDNRIITPQQQDLPAAVKLAQQQEMLHQLILEQRNIHLNALGEAYLRETGLRAEDTMLCEQRAPNGSIRWFFAKKDARAVVNPNVPVQQVGPVIDVDAKEK